MAHRAGLHPPARPGRGLGLLVGASLLVILLGSSHAQDKPFVEITEGLEDSLKKGLKFLSGRQRRSGVIGSQHPIASTALSGIAFLGSGNTPDRGKYADEVRRCVRFLIKRQQRNGYISAPGSTMYDHGFATLFLAEVYGTTADSKIKGALQKAIRLIERTQDGSGGWVYNPAPSGQSDISITICQVMALRAARNVGVSVSTEVVDKAFNCVIRAQNSDGGFSYRIGSGWGGGDSAYPRSAAGCCILYGLGYYEHEATRRALRYLEQQSLNNGNGFYFYARYYASQAMFQAGGDSWRRFWPVLRRELLDSQSRDGSWSQGSGGIEYSTAMACIIFSIPYRYLPILER